jgi:hypothetical protein
MHEHLICAHPSADGAAGHRAVHRRPPRARTPAPARPGRRTGRARLHPRLAGAARPVRDPRRGVRRAGPGDAGFGRRGGLCRGRVRPPRRGDDPVVVPGRCRRRRADRLPHRRQLRDRADRRRPAGPRRHRGRAAARRARPGPGRGAREHAGPASAGGPAHRRGGDRGNGIGTRGPPRQLDPVRPARLAVRRPGGLHPDALVRRLGGRGPAHRAAAGRSAVPGHRPRVHRDRGALPRPGRRHRQLPGPRREPGRAAGRPAATGRRAGWAGGGRGGRAGAHRRLGQRLHVGGHRDGARAHRRTWSNGTERARLCAPAHYPGLPRWHRPGRLGADRPVRAPAGRHRCARRRAHHDVPVRLPQLHRVRGAPPARPGPGRRRRRGAYRARDPGLLRLGPARRRGGRRGGGRHHATVWRARGAAPSWPRTGRREPPWAPPPRARP